MSDAAYSSSVHAPLPARLAGLAAVGLCVWLVVTGSVSWPIAVAAAAVIIATGVYLSTVRLVIGGGRVLVGQGAWGRARTIPTADVAGCEVTSLRWAQVFGFGVPWHRRVTRLTVRPGATLCLTLSSGEVIRVSTHDPVAARRLLTDDPDHDPPAPRRAGR